MATTLTTIGGFMPILLFVEGDYWPAFAVVVAGGVLGSMVLALAFVPAAYVLIYSDAVKTTSLLSIVRTYASPSRIIGTRKI